LLILRKQLYNKLKFGIFKKMTLLKPILYFSLFKYPLTEEEIYSFSEANSIDQIKTELTHLTHLLIIIKIGGFMNFFKLSFQTIKMVFAETPREVFIFLGAIFIIALIVAIFRKRVRSTLLLLFILFFVLLTSHLPGFVVQYQQTLGGVCVGLHKSVELLKKNAITNERDSRDEILDLSEKHKNCIVILEELHNSKGIEKYKVFMRNLDADVVENKLGGMLDELQGMSKSLGSLKALQEVDFAQTSEHLKGMNSFYARMQDAMKNMDATVEDTAAYKDQMEALNKNLSSLNGVYGNVLNAFSVNKG
jgi:hypothetical protein